MKHIAALTVENFQSHVNSEFRFTPGLNVIIGQSDSGKSAAIRALRWALYNEPRGTDFVRHGVNQCRVTVTFSDGVVIVREVAVGKSSSRHKYTVRTPGEPPRVFEGFGADVPPDVTRAHGMPQVYLDKDKGVTLNLGSQLEGPFLLADTATNRARAIGRILGVHVVDAAMRGARRDLQAMARDQTRLEKEIEQYDVQLLEFAGLDEQEAALRRAEEALAQAEALSRRAERLTAAAQRLAAINGQAVQLEGALKALEPLPLAELAALKAEQAAQREKSLAACASRWTQNGAELGRVRAIVDAAMAVAIAEERVGLLDQRSERLRKLEQLAETLRTRTAELVRAEAVAATLAAVADAEERAGALEAKQERLRRLAQVSEAWRARSDEAYRLEAVAGRLTGVTRAEEAAALAEQQQQQLSKLLDRQAQLSRITASQEKGRQLLADVVRDLQDAQREYTQILQSIGRCPTCGSEVGPEHIRQILAELGAGDGD